MPVTGLGLLTAMVGIVAGSIAAAQRTSYRDALLEARRQRIASPLAHEETRPPAAPLLKVRF
jgi:hypothetical protein